MLWERVARTVAPLKPQKKLPAAPGEGVAGSAPRGEAAPDAARPPEAKAAATKAARPLPRPAPELDRNLRRKLARGTEAIEGRIDLHGMTQEEAHGALARFIGASHVSGRKVVLVITGKGRDGDGILRRAVPLWLTGRDLSRFVVSFGPAHASHGGNGALYVRLRSPTRLSRR